MILLVFFLLEYVGTTSPALRSRLTAFPLDVDLEQSIIARMIALSSASVGTTTDDSSCRKLPNFVQSNDTRCVRFSIENSVGLAFSFEDKSIIL